MEIGVAEKKRKDNKQERSNTYKGKNFRGYYQGYENPEFILDIGHSPSQSNTRTGDGVTEYYFNKDIVEKLVPELEARGIKWGILERADGTQAIDTKFVNENFKGSKIIELHNNAGVKSANGIEAMKGSQKKDNDFGRTMANEISAATGLKLRGDKGLRELQRNKAGKLMGAGFMNRMPNLENSLIELGFLTNDKDVELMRKNNGYNVMLGILNGYLVSEGKERATELLAYDKNGNLKEKVQEPKKDDKVVIKKEMCGCEKTISTAPATKPDAAENEKRKEKCLEYIFDVEGKYSNHIHDKGGATKFGIIEKEARKHGYKGDMRNFPKDMAKEIYIKDYYNKNNIDKIVDHGVALSVFDWTVNSGGAVKQIQKMLNNKHGFNLAVDGIIGKNTLAALNSVKPDILLKDINSAQRAYYDYLVKEDPNNKSFHKGWYNRVSKKESFIDKNFGKSATKENNENLPEKLKESAVLDSNKSRTPKETENVKVR